MEGELITHDHPGHVGVSDMAHTLRADTATGWTPVHTRARALHFQAALQSESNLVDRETESGEDGKSVAWEPQMGGRMSLAAAWPFFS